MTAEKYLICHECRSYVYASKNGRLESRPQQMNDIAKFIEDHEYQCEGNMQVWDESIIPPDVSKNESSYKDYYNKGRAP
jgi:hypothetical protein